jgi:predicted amidohydrolase YtcJ
MNLAERAMPRPSLQEQVAGIVEGQRYLHALGVTGWQEAIVGDYAVVPDCYEAYLEAARRGLLTPYLDAHGHPSGGQGLAYFEPGELKAAVTAIDAQGFQVHFHAIGDRAVREALDAVAAARPAAGEPFLPAERVDLATAIAAFTIGSAYVNHAEHETGSLEPGKRADLVVLDRNLFSGPASEIALGRVDMTIVDGQVVYDRGNVR